MKKSRLKEIIKEEILMAEGSFPFTKIGPMIHYVGNMVKQVVVDEKQKKLTAKRLAQAVSEDSGENYTEKDAKQWLGSYKKLIEGTVMERQFGGDTGIDADWDGVSDYGLSDVAQDLEQELKRLKGKKLGKPTNINVEDDSPLEVRIRVDWLDKKKHNWVLQEVEISIDDDYLNFDVYKDITLPTYASEKPTFKKELKIKDMDYQKVIKQAVNLFKKHA